MTALLYFLHTIVIYPLTQVIECLFVFSHKLFKDTGFSVLCLSGAVSVLCLPLYAAAEGQREIEGRTWKRLKPKIDRIKAVFKGDERYMILATYYRQNRYHPVYALRASFGLLVQIPFFIAAYQFLGHLEILRGAGFYRIPDLGAPDGLLRIGGMTVNILPLIMTFFNIASGVMYTKGLEPKDKAQTFGMAALFLALLYNAPSGLALYWTGNNVFSFLKNIYYKIPYTGKRRVVAALFSLLCVGVAAFCAIRFSHNPKAVPLVFLFLVSAEARRHRIFSF